MSDIGAEIRVWVIPIAALVICGIVAWATIGWRVGAVPLLLAILAAALLYVLNHRGVLAWHEERVDPERRTARLLRGLERRGHRVVHARTLPGSDTGLDHIIVGPGGVRTLTSKRFRRQIPMRTMQQDLFHGPQSQRQLLERAAHQAERAAGVIGDRLGHRVSVTPAIVIHGPPVPWKVLRIRGVDVLSGKRLRRYIGVRARQLSTVEVHRVASAIEEAIPPRSEAADAAVAAPAGASSRRTG